MSRKTNGWPGRMFRRNPADEIGSELEHHIEERVRDYMARGMTPDEARRAALERLGDVNRVRDECADLLARERRAGNRRARLNVSWLDVKLGVRMLAKYPGLSFVSVIGMAVAIAVGSGGFAFIQAVMDPSLPLEGGALIVTVGMIATLEPALRGLAVQPTEVLRED